ncbi:M1 family aminopeptidase [uncultured Hymenobacter sp.]|uniref:M1 family aminopeptidase n=1 Tax=uncultured Hymenobacter sp. TaxID=170016 RepID=UPI0035CB044F
MRVQLQLAPATGSFTCRYTFTLPASDTTSTIQLNLNRHFPLQRLSSPGALRRRISRTYYSFFADTMQRVEVQYAPHNHKARQLTLTYAGTLDKSTSTAQVMELSGHSNWVPFRSNQEYEIVKYTLAVRAPAAYQVRSTTPALRQRRGRWLFSGRTSNIEITALVAKQFHQVVSATAPLITVVKAGAALVRQDTALLHQAAAIIGFYNRTIGRQDSIARFTIFLPGTNRDAFGLLDNATVITYPGFDVAEREYVLILAHEISHKWWSYGSFHDYNDWLNEAFATYSSLLYLQAIGDTAGYQQEYAKRAQTTANTPAILGFDRDKYERSMYRRVVYNKGTVVLAALHARVGTEKFYALLATTAARKISTTAAFLEVVEQTAGPATRTWLQAELTR